MKSGIHPRYYPNAKVVCACGNAWETGSTKPELRTDICSKCHPFFTGEAQRIVDRAGQVDRFTRRFATAQTRRQEASARQEAKAKRQRERQIVDIVDENEDVEPIAGVGTES